MSSAFDCHRADRRRAALLGCHRFDGPILVFVRLRLMLLLVLPRFGGTELSLTDGLAILSRVQALQSDIDNFKGHKSITVKRRSRNGLRK